MHTVEGVPADFSMNATALSAARAPTRARPAPATDLEAENRTNLTLTIGEGDNIQYSRRHMRELWDDPARGSVPMHWTVSPLVEVIGPALLHHFQRTAGENDLLVCGPSGAGYTYGDSWPEDQLGVYTRLTGEYMGRTGLDAIFAYSTPDHDSAPPALPDRVLAAYAADGELRGILQTDELGDISRPGAAVPLIGNFYPPGGVDVYREELLAKIERERGDGPCSSPG